jgi:hypothetical protein
MRHLMLLLAAFCAFAQPRHPVLEDAMRKTGLRIQPATSQPKASSEIRLRLLTPQTPRPGVTAHLIQRIHRNDPPPRQRSAEMSHDHLLVVVLDGRGTVRFWQIVVDPRLVRGEFPDTSGSLRKTEVYRPDAELNFSIPDGLDAAEVRILAPSWPNGELTLAPVSSLKLAQTDRQ